MDFDAFARAFGVNPANALRTARSKRKGLWTPDPQSVPDPWAEPKRSPLGPGGLSRGAESGRSQSTVYVSQEAPTGVHKGRRVRGILEETRRYFLRRAVMPPGLAEIFNVKDNTPDSVPCDGEYIVRCAAPGGGFPTFPLLPSAYGTATHYLMRAISTLHTLWGDNRTHIRCADLVERIEACLQRLRGDPREA